MALWLVRHALPLVAERVCYGASDVPADGLATSRSAQALAQQLPAGARLWCSPLQRCRQLAQALAPLRPDLRVHPSDARLAEMDFGCWEGVPWEAIPRAEIDAWTAQFWRHRFGGRESVAELMARVSAAWAETRNLPGPTVWITHAGVIRAATLLAEGVMAVERADQWPAQPLDFGAVLRV